MPVITKIAEQKRRENRRNIHLDGKFAFGINLNVVARFKLREGMTLTEAQVAEIAAGEVRQVCMDHALRLLQMRLHSRAELSKKLARREYGPGVIDSVLDDLTRLGYVDDARFAKTRALSAAQHKHHGRRRAFVELIKNGVSDATARLATQDVYESHDSLAAARQLAKKKAPGLKRLDPVVAKRRLVGLLQRRGFTYDEIRPVIDEVLGPDAEAHAED
jgi:regulatory protein